MKYLTQTTYTEGGLFSSGVQDSKSSCTMKVWGNLSSVPLFQAAHHRWAFLSQESNGLKSPQLCLSKNVFISSSLLKKNISGCGVVCAFFSQLDYVSSLTLLSEVSNEKSTGALLWISWQWALFSLSFEGLLALSYHSATLWVGINCLLNFLDIYVRVFL